MQPSAVASVLVGSAFPGRVKVCRVLVGSGSAFCGTAWVRVLVLKYWTGLVRVSLGTGLSFGPLPRCSCRLTHCWKGCTLYTHRLLFFNRTSYLQPVLHFLVCFGWFHWLLPSVNCFPPDRSCLFTQCWPFQQRGNISFPETTRMMLCMFMQEEQRYIGTRIAL